MMKGNLDNFEQCEKNIKKNQDPTGGNPDYWRDKYAPKKHTKTYLKRKYKPRLRNQEYYIKKYIYNENEKKQSKPDSTDFWGRLTESEKITIIFLIVVYVCYKLSSYI